MNYDISKIKFEATYSMLSQVERNRVDELMSRVNQYGLECEVISTMDDYDKEDMSKALTLAMIDWNL